MTGPAQNPQGLGPLLPPTLVLPCGLPGTLCLFFTPFTPKQQCWQRASAEQGSSQGLPWPWLLGILPSPQGDIWGHVGPTPQSDREAKSSGRGYTAVSRYGMRGSRMGRGEGTAGGQDTGGPWQGKMAAGGSGMAPGSHHPYLCLLFFRDPDSDLRDEEEAEMKEIH